MLTLIAGRCFVATECVCESCTEIQDVQESICGKARFFLVNGFLHCLAGHDDQLVVCTWQIFEIAHQRVCTCTIVIMKTCVFSIAHHNWGLMCTYKHGYDGTLMYIRREWMGMSALLWKCWRKLYHSSRMNKTRTHITPVWTGMYIAVCGRWVHTDTAAAGQSCTLVHAHNDDQRCHRHVWMIHGTRSWSD